MKMGEVKGTLLRQLSSTQAISSEVGRGLHVLFVFNVICIHAAFLENPLDEALISTQLNVLRKKLEELDIDTESCVPGQTNHLLCPMVLGF